MLPDEIFQDAEIRRRLDCYVLARITTAAEIKEKESGKPMVLAKHAAFADLSQKPGIAVVDLTDPKSPHFGDVVSIYPLANGTSISRPDLAALLDLPPGSLTQRTLVFAVRTHPDSPLSTSGTFLPLLSSAAESHAAHQASIMLQGHHHWDQRFHQLNDQLPSGLVAQEVCAESWPGQQLFEAARECVDSWRHSAGHWSAVQKAHPVFGYDMKRGRNGVWYATGIFGTQR